MGASGGTSGEGSLIIAVWKPADVSAVPSDHDSVTDHDRTSNSH